MNRFSQLPEFEKEFSKLSRKYSSLFEDLKKLEKLLSTYPVGVGINFVTIYHSPEAKIVKARLACKSLKNRSIRVIYAYHDDSTTFDHIEIYYKGDKENENQERIKRYLKTLK